MITLDQLQIRLSQESSRLRETAASLETLAEKINYIDDEQGIEISDARASEILLEMLDILAAEGEGQPNLESIKEIINRVTGSQAE